MIPKSRLERRGAYRNVLPNFINGKVDEEIFLSSKGNSLVSSLCNLTIKSIRNFNNLEFLKNIVLPEKSSTPFIASLDINIGKENSGKISFMSDEKKSFSVNISIGNNNNLDFETYDNDNINIGDNNTILDSFDTKNNGVTIGRNNFLVDFKSEIKKGCAVKGFPKIGPLMFSTKVSENTKIGQKYIKIDNVDKVSINTEIIFGSTHKGFVRRVVNSVDGNNVYFDEPLTYKESSFQGAMAFNEYTQILEPYSSIVTKDIKKGSKRIFVKDNKNLHLRKIRIGDSFNTMSFFIRESDNMMIIKDMSPKDFSDGTSIVSDGLNPYSTWDTSVVQDSDIKEKYTISGINKSFIGRKAVLTAKGIESTFSISGFTENTITFDSPLPDGTTTVSFDGIDSSPSGSMVTSYVSNDVPGNTINIPVQDASLFFVGQKIKLEGTSVILTIAEIKNHSIITEDKLFNDTINNKFFVGMYELSKDTSVPKAILAKAKANIHSFLFGDKK